MKIFSILDPVIWDEQNYTFLVNELFVKVTCLDLAVNISLMLSLTFHHDLPHIAPHDAKALPMLCGNYSMAFKAISVKAVSSKWTPSSICNLKGQTNPKSGECQSLLYLHSTVEAISLWL